MRLVIPDLLPGRQYAIQVRADDGSRQSEWSTRYMVTTINDTILPLTPSAVTWVASGDSFFGTWSPVMTNVNGDQITIARYEVELTSGSTVKVVTAPQKTETTLSYSLGFEENRALFGSPKSSIDMRVRAVDTRDNKGQWSTTITATNAAPAAPTGPAVGSVATASTDSISLAWTAPADNDVVGYNVYVGTAAAFVPAVANKIYSGNANRFVYLTTTYSLQYFKIRAVDKFGQESLDLTANATPGSPFTADTTAPSIPTALGASLTNTPNDAGAIAQVTWTYASPPSDLAGFVVQFRRVGQTNWTQVSTDKDARALTVQLDQAYTNYEFQIKARDWQANESAFSVTTVGNGQANSAPSTPSTPTVAANTLQIQVVLDGLKAAGGSMETDVTAYEVYASTTTGFTPASANMLGVIPVGPALVSSFDVPASGGTATQTWYVRVIAVDRGGLKSAPSAQTTSNVALISSTNITDASITNAKIFDLAANKITAGSGFVNDITVKSKFTLGDATTVGAIESFGYVAGSAGFRLDKNLLEINQGSVAASALKIQLGQNLMPPQYADFEWLDSYYQAAITSLGSGIIRNTTTNAAKFNTQSYGTLWGAGGTGTSLALGISATDYNIVLEPTQTYILSMYAWVGGSVATTVQLKIKFSDASIVTVATATPSVSGGPNTATRMSGTFTVPAGVTRGMVMVDSPSTAANSGYSIDGIQLELKQGALNTPSNWAPPSVTTINGGMIRTGSITSSATARVISAVALYNTAGDTIIGYGNPVEIDDPSARPAWFVNAQGNAEFSNMSIRGNVVVGNPSGGSPDTTAQVSVTINTTSGSAVITSVAGTYNRLDVGLAISGPGIPAGTTVSSFTDDMTVGLSASATATATGVLANITRPARVISAMSSADYIQGTRGWTIRSDGYSEFRSLAADSIDGVAIRAQTLDAKAIKTGTLEADISLSGSFQTASNPTEIIVSMTTGSAAIILDGSVVDVFTAADVGVTIAGTGIPDATKILTFTDATHATMSANATATSTTQSVRIYRGRTAKLSGAGGLVLTDQYGTEVVKLPTNPKELNYFAGSVEATYI